MILLALGGIGGSFQPIRIFIILSLPWIIKYCLNNKSVVVSYRYEIHVFFIWFFYAIISLLWVITPTESIKEVIYLFVNFSGFVLLVLFSNNAKQPKESIIKGWILFFVLTLPIALIELIFDKHLSIAYQSENLMMNFGGGVALQRNFASVTFGNLNGYNTVLVYVIPFLLGSLMHDKYFSKFRRIISLILMVLLSVIIVMNSSRSAFICLLIAVFIFILFYIKNIKTFIGTGLVFAIIIGVFLFSNSNIFDFLFIRFQTQGLGDSNRYILVEEGLKQLQKSGFMGIGAADFIPTMREVENLDNFSPHNFFLEVLVQYGLIIFILFIALFVRIIKKNRYNNKRFAYITTTSLIMLPLTFSIDSSYLLSVSTWIYIASLYIIVDKKYNYDNLNYENIDCV